MVHNYGMQQLNDRIKEKDAEIERLNTLINNPHADDFLESVRTEAAHQRERWGEAHDVRKMPHDWFWALGYLSGKCVMAHIKGDKDKALHHTISSAALLMNWHKSISGE